MSQRKVHTFSLLRSNTSGRFYVLPPDNEFPLKWRPQQEAEALEEAEVLYGAVRADETFITRSRVVIDFDAQMKSYTNGKGSCSQGLPIMKTGCGRIETLVRVR